MKETFLINILIICIITRGYLPYVTNPTRFAKLSASLLDHIYVKTVSNQKEIFSGILTSKISDHLATICCIPLKSKHQKSPNTLQLMQIPKRIIKKLNVN